jgi:hypothetical protein
MNSLAKEYEIILRSKVRSAYYFTSFANTILFMLLVCLAEGGHDYRLAIYGVMFIASLSLNIYGLCNYGCTILPLIDFVLQVPAAIRIYQAINNESIYRFTEDLLLFLILSIKATIIVFLHKKGSYYDNTKMHEIYCETYTINKLDNHKSYISRMTVL